MRGREVVAVGADEGVGHIPAVWPTLPRENLSRCRSSSRRIEHRRRKIQVRDAIVFLGQRRDVFVTHAQVQRQISAHLPFILQVGVPEIAVKVVAVFAELHRCLLRQAEQKVGEVISRSGDCAARRRSPKC